MADDKKWSRPSNPPSPLFLGAKERDFVKQVNDELIERTIGQQIVYYPLDLDRTDYHPLYGEAIKKSFSPPIRVFALVEWDEYSTEYVENVGLDKKSTIKIHFHHRRLTEDQDLFVREGDFILYGLNFYEIVQLEEPKQIFGQIEKEMEISALCIISREGLFDAT
jgi:hypothetical protein